MCSDTVLWELMYKSWSVRQLYLKLTLVSEVGTPDECHDRREIFSHRYMLLKVPNGLMIMLEDIPYGSNDPQPAIAAGDSRRKQPEYRHHRGKTVLLPPPGHWR